MSTNMAQKKFFILASIFLLVLSLGLTATSDTLVVSKNEGWFNSIQKAIDKAEPGDTVKVKKGIYKENLAVDKDLTIKGKDTKEVKIKGVKKGEPVLVAGPSRIDLTMVNVTLQGAEGEKCEDRQKGICPDGLVARGESAVTLKSSAFQQNKDTGISLRDSARATIQDSKIAGNDYGVQLDSSSQATIEKSEITDNSGDGIQVGGSAQTTITNNKLSGNGSGIVIHNSAQATIKHNVLRGNDTGIANYSNGTVEFQDNEIGDNLVNFVGNIDGKLRDRLREPTHQKIVLPDEDYPSLQHAIDALQPGGTIVLEGKLEGGAVVDKELTIKARGKDTQVFLPEKANAPVLSVIKGGDLKLEGLKVKSSGDTGSSGIVLGGNAKLQLENSTVRGSSYSVELTNSAQATITKSSLIGALSFSNSVKTTVKNSKLLSEFIGIILWGSAQATVINSKIRGKYRGIFLGDSARILAEYNKISGNEGTGVSLYQMAQATLSNNEITENKKAGVTLADLARADISNNDITENGAGILLHGSAQALVGYNTIRKNKTGIKTSQGFGGTLEGSDNQVAENDMNFQGVPETVQKELTKS